MNMLLRATAPPAMPGPSAAPGQVPGTFIADLKSHGMTAPIRGLCDPRLQYPELLLIDGWDREDPPDGCLYAYTYAADASSDGSQRWEQTWQCGKDGSAQLVTRCGHTESVTRRDGQGRINTVYRTV